MSFAEITKDYSPKTQEVLIEVNGNVYKFIAHEMSFLASQEIGLKQTNGENWLEHLLVNSIKDEQGNHMSADQAQRLSPEHADKFIAAAVAVNSRGESEKN